MIKVQFLNEYNKRTVGFNKVNDNVVKLTGANANDSGFLTFRMNEEPLGDFSDYNTIYKEEDGSVMYSNDGSVYVDFPMPEPVDDIPFTPSPEIPTLEERVADLEMAMIEIFEAMGD